MIRNHRGEPVETNATERDAGMIQVLFVHADAIRGLEEWLDTRGFLLFRVPEDDGEGVPIYGITPNDATLREGRPR